MKSIYILLTKSDTYFSRFIHYMTSDEYTHSSIALDRNLDQVYSFGRRNPRLMWPAGFVREDVRSGLFKRCESNNCCLFELTVSDEIYTKIEENLTGMMQEADKYHYNLLGAFYCKMNRERPKENKYFCSEFVSELLERYEIAELPKATGLMRPIDFYDVKELNLLYYGELKNCMQ
ncbi:MAG: hypothetical protein VB012_05055 [Erysipelotrichaceae bacterium]|nr:hypothetical protein [Erysipelotrichaceae bacterium]